jgi:hypothetical protein
MNAVLGDSFPANIKNDFAKQKLIPGNVIFCYADAAGKEKRLVILGINSDKSLVAVLLFNSKKPFVGDKVLEPLQVHFKSQDNPYLKHDCYLNCAHIKIIPYKNLFDDLVTYPEHSLGKMSPPDFDRVCTVAANTRNISPKNVKRFGLTGYLLQK